MLGLFSIGLDEFSLIPPYFAFIILHLFYYFRIDVLNRETIVMDDSLGVLLKELRSPSEYLERFQRKHSSRSFISELYKSNARRTDNAEWVQSKSCADLFSEEKTTYQDLPKCRDCHVKVLRRKEGSVCRFQDFRRFELKRGSQKPIVGLLDCSCINDVVSGQL